MHVKLGLGQRAEQQQRAFQRGSFVVGAPQDQGVVVDLAELRAEGLGARRGDAGAQALDTVAALCEDGSRTPAGGSGSEAAGFVCRFQGDNVFAAVASEGRLVTLAASAVPPDTTAARLVVAFGQQVAALAR